MSSVPEGILMSAFLASACSTEARDGDTLFMLGEVPKVSFQKATVRFFSVLCFDCKPTIMSASSSWKFVSEVEVKELTI